MKKFAKILSILLCVSMLVGMIAMVATAEEPAAPATEQGAIKQGNVLEIVSPKRLTAVFGMYTDGTGDDESTFQDGGDGKCLTNGWYGQASYAEITRPDSTDKGYLIAAVIEVDDIINFGGIEILAHDQGYSAGYEGDGDLRVFSVEAYVDGEWVELAHEGVLGSVNYEYDATRAFTATFEAVKTNKVRILIPKYWDAMCKIRNVALYEEKTGNVKTNVDLSKVTSTDTPVAAQSIDKLTDGNKAREAVLSNATVDMTADGKPTTIDGIILYPFRADRAMASNVTVSVKTAADGDWAEIGTFATGWEEGALLDPAVITFDKAYEAYEMKVTFDKYGYISEMEGFAFEREAVETPETPSEPDPSEVVYKGFKTADIGYYDVNGEFVTHIWNASVPGASLIDGITDASTGNEGATGNIFSNEMTVNGGDKQMAILFGTGDEPITLNGLEIVYSQNKYKMVDFKIQVKTEKDGQWITVYEDKNVEHDAEQIVYNYMFDTVTAYEVRFLIDKVIPKYNSDGTENKSIVAMREVSPWVVTKTEEPTPEEPEAPVEPDPSVATDGVLPAPQAGYYDGEGNFVPALYQHKDVYKDPALLVDGNKDYGQWRSYQFEYAELKQHGGTQVPAIVFDLSAEPVTLNGLNLWCYTGLTWMVDFRVQVKTSADGEWETVGTYTDVNNTDNGYWLEGDEYLYYFDKTVTAYALQILVDNFDKGSDDDNARWVYQLYEIVPMIVEVEEPEQPEDPTVPSEPETSEPDPSEPETSEPETSEPETSEPETSEPETTEPEATEPTYLDTVAPDRLDTLLGHYTDKTGDDESTFVDGGEGANLTDGSLDTVGTGNCTYSDGLVAVIINVDETIKFAGIQFVAYDRDGEGDGDLRVFKVQALVDGEWVELLSVNEWPHKDSRTVTYLFGEAVETDTIRVLVEDYYDGEFKLKEISLFEEKVGEPEQPEDPTDPSEPEQPTDPSEPALELDAAYLQYAALPEPIFGYYDANGELVSYTYGDWTGANIVDGNLFTLGCTDYFKDTSELLQNGGTKHPVVYFDMGNNPMTINGLQYITNWNENCCATDLYIQVKTSDDGEWETVYEASGLDFNENECKDFRFKTVTVYEMRIVITAFQYPAGNERCAIQEISPWVVVDGPKPIQIPIAAVTGGYYDDGEEMSNLVGGFMASNVADGMWQNFETIGTENDEWIFATDLLSGRGGIYTPAFILYFDEPQVISRVEVYAQRGILGAYFPSEIVIQAEDENGDWITVAEGTSADWEGTAVFEFTPVQTQQIRVLATVINRVNGEAAHYRVNEIVVYSYEGAVPGETPEEPTEPSVPEETDPTDPSVPEETDPTDPSVPEETDPTDPSVPEETDPTDPSVPEETDPTDPEDQPGKTGDIALSVLVGMLAISAIGGAVVISKKKEF